MVEVGRNHLLHLVKNPLLKQGHLDPVAQDHIQVVIEYLQVWKNHNVPEQPEPLLNHPHSKKVFPDVQAEPSA